MAQQSPLAAVVAGWSKRANAAQQVGVPFDLVKQIAKPDIQRVMRGGTGMTNTQANLALASATRNQAIIQPPKRKTGPLNIIGNIPSDFGDVIHGLLPWNIVKAGYREGQQAVKEFQTKETPFHDLHNPGDVIRAVSEQPIVRFIPGIHTLGGLTTSEGRKELERHPLMTAIDVGIPAGKFAKLGTAGTVATEGSRLGETGALEALQGGHLLKAGSRYSGLSDTLKTLAEKGGVSTDIREGISRPYAQIQRQYTSHLSKLQQDRIKTNFEGMNPDQVIKLTEDAKYFHPNDPSITPEHKAKIEQIRPLLEEFGDKDILEVVGAIPDETSTPPTVRIPLPNGRDAIYSPDSIVAKDYSKLNNTASRVTKWEEKLSTAQDKLSEAQAKLESRKSKPIRFMESPESHAARPSTETSSAAILNAAAPLIESFRELNPAEVYQQIPEAVTKTNARGIRMGLRKLAWKNVSTTEEGLFGKFADAMTAGKYRDASKLLRQINHVLNYTSFDGIGSIERMRAYITQLQPELYNLRSREGAYNAATRLVSRAENRVAKVEASLNSTKEILDSRQNKFTKSLLTNPEARYIPLVERAIRQGAVDIARQYVTEQGFNNAVNQIRNATSFEDFKNAFRDEDGVINPKANQLFDDLITDAKSSWLDMRAQGFDPLWIHNTPVERLEFGLGTVRALPDKLRTPGVLKEKVTSFSPHVQSVAVGITEAARQLLSAKATEHFINEFVIPLTKKVRDLKKEYFPQLADSEIPTYSSLPGEVQKAINKDWVPFDPKAYMEPSKVRLGHDEELMLPKHISKALDMMLTKDRLPVHGLYNRTMGIYKLAVLTGPRHVAHVAFGGLAMILGREPGAVLRLKDALDTWKAGDIDPRLSRGIDFHSTDEIANIAIGKQLGKWYKEIPGNIVKRVGRFEEAISDMYRIAVKLSAEKRGLNIDEAIQQANKVLVDIDGMTPVERVILKQVFPFYTFTSHLLRYVLSYPADYPLRAAILTRLAQQQQEEWNTGLPESMMNLLWLGKPSSAGEAKAIDIKSTNPFRSLENIFTLAGFTSSLNPFAQSILSASGINTLQAVPELYPEVSYDPTTGSLQAKRTDVVPKILGSFIPVSGAIDHFLGISKNMRDLKQSNPDAYRSFLFSQLNLPFTPYLGLPGTPAKKNIKTTIAHTELNRYEAATKAVASALRTGDTSELSRFTDVPLYSQYVTPELIRKLLASINTPSSISPRAVITPPKTRSGRTGKATGSSSKATGSSSSVSSSVGR